MPALLRIAFGLLVLAAIGSQLVIHVDKGFNVLNFFSYFTNLSNLFAAAVLLLTGWRAAAARLRPTTVDALRAASTVNMAVVGIVFVLLLRDVDLGSLQPWVNSLLHHVMPCVVMLDWLWQPPTRRPPLRTLLGMLVFPMLYLLYVVVRGEMVGWYPYPFMNPSLAGGAGGVALHAAGIALLFAVLGGVVLASGHRRRRA